MAPRACLDALPLELLLQIMSYLPHPRHLNALCRCNRLLWQLLAPHLYRKGSVLIFSDGKTALHRCKTNDAVLALLAMGSRPLLNLPIEGKGRDTRPLALAILNERWAQAELFLAVGASRTRAHHWLSRVLSKKPERKAAVEAALLAAVATGRVRLLRLWDKITLPAERWFQDAEGFTLLHRALRWGGNPQVIVWILSTPEPPELRFRKFKNGQTVLEYAVARNMWEVVRLLATHVPLKAGLAGRNTVGETMLHVIARRASSKTVAAVLKAHITVDTKDREGKTALHVAVSHGTVDTVKVLLEKGANAVLWDSRGAGALHTAVRRKRWDVVEAMVKAGVDVGAKDRGGMTAGERGLSEGVEMEEKIKKLLGFKEKKKKKGGKVPRPKAVTAPEVTKVTEGMRRITV